MDRTKDKGGKIMIKGGHLQDFFYKVMWSRELWEVSSELAFTVSLFLNAVLDYCEERIFQSIEKNLS